uniref:Uncharacterized protein n=1 Tax=Parascaris equorum TaxID=6256 RepID=A0A914RK65_PAREQ
LNSQKLFQASRIKVLDPIFIPIEAASNGHQVFHQYCSDGSNSLSSKVSSRREDDDIERALRKLEESRNMLDEPVAAQPNVIVPMFSYAFSIVSNTAEQGSIRQTGSSDLPTQFGSTSRPLKSTAYQGLFVLRFSSRANFVKSDEPFLQFITGKEREEK